MPLAESQVAAILSDGAFHTLDDYAQREPILETLTAAFFEGIERFAGAAVRARVEADGLSQLHRHFPIARIRLLEAFLLRRLRDDLYYWSYRVGAETLGLAAPFYIDHLIVFRIHYPFLVARQAKHVDPPPQDWKDRLRILAATVRDPEALAHYVGRAWRHRRAPRESATFNPSAYHRGLAEPARAHGPHIDTWYGHSYGGINLWLSIDGVNLDNTVILYPDMFGRPTTYDPGSMYLAPGIPLSPPSKIALRPGQLFVFNSEMLHGTQVNISDETRVALTTRINPEAPRFAPNAPFHMEHWLPSEDVARRRFMTRVFLAHRHPGEPAIAPAPAYVDQNTVRIRVDAPPERGTAAAVCRADELKSGDKVAADLGKLKIVLWRGPDGVKAFTRTCPHLGLDLADGSHDDCQLFCPGHGIAFSWNDGSSTCSAFRLQALNAYEKDGTVYVTRDSAATSN